MYLEGISRDACRQRPRQGLAPAPPRLAVGLVALIVIHQEVCKLVIVVQVIHLVLLPAPPLSSPLRGRLLLVHVLQVCTRPRKTGSWPVCCLHKRLVALIVVH